MLVVVGCYSQPDAGDDDATTDAASTGTDAGPSSASSNSATGTSVGSSADSGDATTNPVADSGDSTTDGPMTSGTTTGEDTGTDSSGGSSTGGVPACGEDPVAADLPGPATAACGSSWVIGDITFQIQNSGHPSCGTGGCSAGIAQGQGGVWVYPAQLYADLTGITCEPSVVDVTLTDYASGAFVTLYDDSGNVIASDYSNLSGGNQETVSLAVPLGATLAGVGAHGCETLVHRVEVH